MKIVKVPLDQIEPWPLNPRNIKTVDFDRVKNQIKKLGFYKPLIVYQEGDKYITLGGDKRLRALREFKVKEVEVSIVEPSSEANKLEYCLSDNDNPGQWDDLALAELAQQHRAEMNLADFKVDLGTPIGLGALLADFGPDEDGPDTSDLDEEAAEADDFKAVLVTLEIPAKFEDKLLAWITEGGERSTPRGLGNGILKRCGLL